MVFWVIFAILYILAIVGMAEALEDIRYGTGWYKDALSERVLRLVNYRTARIAALLLAPFIIATIYGGMLVFVVVAEVPSIAQDAFDNLRRAVRK